MRKKIKLRESAYILKESEQIYQVVYTGTRKIKRIQVDSLVKEVIEQLKSEHDLSAVVANLGRVYPQQDVNACLDALEDLGIIVRYDDSPIDERNRRQLSFLDELTNPWWILHL